MVAATHEAAAVVVDVVTTPLTSLPQQFPNRVPARNRLPSAADAHQHGQQLLQLAAWLPNQRWLRDHRRTRSGAVEVLPSTQRGLARQSTPPVRAMLCM